MNLILVGCSLVTNAKITMEHEELDEEDSPLSLLDEESPTVDEEAVPSSLPDCPQRDFDDDTCKTSTSSHVFFIIYTEPRFLTTIQPFTRLH